MDLTMNIATFQVRVRCSRLASKLVTALVGILNEIFRTIRGSESRELTITTSIQQDRLSRVTNTVPSLRKAKADFISCSMGGQAQLRLH